MSHLPDIPPEGDRGRRVTAVDRVFLRLLTRIHRALMAISGGRLLSRFGNADMIVVTTIGRTTGQRRTMPLFGFRVGDDWLVAASNGGARSHPQWLSNMRANPDVDVKVRGTGKPTPMRARILTDTEKAEHWPNIVGAFKNWVDKTDRDIPLVHLSTRQTES